MFRQIKKIEILIGICMILQILFSSFFIPFHLIGMLLSIIIVCWQRKFCIIQIGCHYIIIVLYVFRLFLLFVLSYSFLEIIYLVISLYVGIILILLSFKTFL